MLLAAISESLSSLQLGLKGLVVITPELESVLSALTNGIVPELWSKCYPSIKPLGTWVRDLLDRVEFFNEWIDLRLPAIFWLSAFTYPTGLTTGVLQTAARKNVVSVDSLSWDFVVLDGANVETALLATVRSHARRSTALDLRGDLTCPLLYLLSSSSSLLLSHHREVPRRGFTSMACFSREQSGTHHSTLSVMRARWSYRRSSQLCISSRRRVLGKQRRIRTSARCTFTPFEPARVSVRVTCSRSPSPAVRMMKHIGYGAGQPCCSHSRCEQERLRTRVPSIE